MSTADELVTNAYQLVGTVGVGETVETALLDNGLVRINQMISGWRLQPGTILTIERQVFDLTANQQTYTIGSGGDFDVPRPVTIGTMGGLLQHGLNAAVTVTITRVSTTATVSQTAHGLSAGDLVYLTGATQTAYNGLQTVGTTPTANSWTFTVSGSPTTPATGTITAQTTQANPVEIPCPVITQDAYQNLRVKTQTSSQFTEIYYSATEPLGTITLWPMPTTGANQLVLYLQSVFASFADLSTDYTWPDVPGYALAITYNLALPLWVIAHGSVPVPSEIKDLAWDTLSAVKAANLPMIDLCLDQALTGQTHGSGYVIQTDQGA